MSDALCADIHRLLLTLRLRFRLLANHSPERLKRELQLGYVERNFQQIRYASLAASASLLSSVTAFDLINVIICKNEGMSRLGNAWGWRTSAERSRSVRKEALGWFHQLKGQVYPFAIHETVKDA